MWIIAPAGFFSAVAGRRRGTVQVRARRRQDLEGLRRRFRIKARIKDTPAADYPHRLVVRTATWIAMLAALASDCAGYGNFKAELERVEGKGSARAAAAHEIWAVLRRLEDEEAGRVTPDLEAEADETEADAAFAAWRAGPDRRKNFSRRP